MNAGLVRRWLNDGALNLPLPGSATAHRWRRLAKVAEVDLVARVGRSPVDAVAVLTEPGGGPRIQ